MSGLDILAGLIGICTLAAFTYTIWKIIHDMTAE